MKRLLIVLMLVGLAGCMTATPSSRRDFAEGTTSDIIFRGVADDQRAACVSAIASDGVFGDRSSRRSRCAHATATAWKRPVAPSIPTRVRNGHGSCTAHPEPDDVPPDAPLGDARRAGRWPRPRCGMERIAGAATIAA